MQGVYKLHHAVCSGGTPLQGVLEVLPRKEQSKKKREEETTGGRVPVRAHSF